MFPSVVKAGIGLGGEYGEGAAHHPRPPGEYYNLISGSFGFQLGVQARTVIIMFMTERRSQASKAPMAGRSASTDRWPS
jgi:lipid-binding SYLF domain-containing protein